MDRNGTDYSIERISGRAKLFELIGIILALEERADLTERERRRLDREIGSASGSQQRPGIPLLRVWLDSAPSEALRQRLAGLRSSLRGLGWLLIAISFFFGWGAASALLSIEIHAGRINIVLAVALLVALPFLSTVVASIGWLWAMRPSSSGRSRSLTGQLGRIGVGRLAARMTPPFLRPDLEILSGRLRAHGHLYGRVERGQLLLLSQSMGLAFGLGALVATLGLITFTDLAFGWSTTLDVSASQVHRGARVLAMPFTWIWPAANPSIELVEATRYFRVAPVDHNHVIDPILLGGWWPFLASSIFCYAVLPRLFMIAAVSITGGREIGRAIGLTPGVDRLLDRLTTPMVEVQALSEELEVGRPSDTLVPETTAIEWVTRYSGPEPRILRWAESASDASLRSVLGAQAIRLSDAGGRSSMDEDAAVARGLAEGTAGVVFCVRGYEPPVLDVLDYLKRVREHMGPERSLLVLLMGAREADIRPWRRRLTTLGDPQLVVATAEAADG